MRMTQNDDIQIPLVTSINDSDAGKGDTLNVTEPGFARNIWLFVIFFGMLFYTRYMLLALSDNQSAGVFDPMAALLLNDAESLCKRMLSAMGKFNASVDCSPPRRPRSCIRVLQIGRFGNAFWALQRAFHLAENMGIKEIHIPYGYTMYTKSFRWHDIFLIVDKDPRETELRCYNIWPFDAIPGAPRRNVTFDYAFKQSVALQFSDALVDIPDDWLAIHIRTGDLFALKVPHSDYGQPPCGYYRDILEGKNWSKVLLFAEDRLNPCVNVVRSYGAVHVQSTLRNEIGMMISTKNLVIGYGTFGITMATVSMKLRNLWTCRNKARFKVDNHFDCDPVDVYTQNVLGRGKWHNTNDQHALMLNSTCKSWSIVEDSQSPKNEGTIVKTLRESSVLMRI